MHIKYALQHLRKLSVTAKPTSLSSWTLTSSGPEKSLCSIFPVLTKATSSGCWQQAGPVTDRHKALPSPALLWNGLWNEAAHGDSYPQTSWPEPGLCLYVSTVRDQGRPAQVVLLWYTDHFEPKKPSRPEDSERYFDLHPLPNFIKRIWIEELLQKSFYHG